MVIDIPSNRTGPLLLWSKGIFGMI